MPRLEISQIDKWATDAFCRCRYCHEQCDEYNDEGVCCHDDCESEAKGMTEGVR